MPARQDTEAPNASPDSHGQAYNKSSEGKGPEQIKSSFYWSHQQQFNLKDYLGASIGHQWPTTQWLSQFGKGRDYQIDRQPAGPSDRAHDSSRKWEMSCLPLEWVGPTCQHEMEWISISWGLTLSLIHPFASLTLSNSLKNKARTLGAIEVKDWRKHWRRWRRGKGGQHQQ